LKPIKQVNYVMESSETAFGLIFDMDGVLVDTGEFHKKSWFALAERVGWKISEGQFWQTFGMQNPQIIPMVTDRSYTWDQIQSLGEWKERRFRALSAGGVDLLPGVQRLIEQCKRAGFRVAVGSSGPRANVEMIVRATDIANQFDALVTGDDVSRGKPAPDTFLKAAEKLGVSPARCVVIEDAVQGVQAGKAAGAKVIAVTNTRKREDLWQADRVLDSLEEITEKDLFLLIS